MSTDNTSVVLRAVEDIAFEPRPVPEVGPTEVLVEVKKTGICGSDVHYLVHGRIGDFVVNSPMVLGHESSGIVSKGRFRRPRKIKGFTNKSRPVGSKVKHLKVGTRVALEPGATCRVCDDCKAGRYELCPDIVFAATPPYDGTLGRYYKLPADLAYPLPDHLTYEDGAMMEPLSVGVHSVYNIGQIRANQRVAVFGAGPVGLLCMAVAKACGASRVIAVDIVQARLDFAKGYAATDVFAPPKMQEGETKIAYSRRASAELSAALGVEDRGPNAIDLVIEATGAEVCIQMAIFLAKIGGTVVQVGMGSAEAQIPVTLALVKELALKGSFRYPGDYPAAIALVASGKLDLKPLVTHRFAFKDAIKAFDVNRKGKSDDGKGVIKAIISGPDVDTESL
ncbi:xylitol dehydrogenase [Sistotremastrum suecicum HHB10207 ss-3]|uniref:Xylitol dehydrogenase n=1 Tax=Sistotremastrum suecicum HHB10207 ss-3 TaxID=1314776 RepID=A0A166G0G1_9AGAM|nr:xylitol dehydrogenase [Sistotremastrum suecicum HHB10207 ss-3]